MCGFLLILDGQGVREEDALGALATLAARGPDDEGHVILGERAGLFLGHRRLSIIGLTPENRQPYRHGNVLLAFNGEIYNYLELREQLRGEGASFAQENSDTEVLAAGLALHGEAFLSRLNGMYAGVALFEDTGELLLFRDPTGQKPFYYLRTPDRLIAASEPKAIRAYQPREVDEDRLRRGFLLGYHNEGSVYRGVETLAPGRYARLDPARVLASGGGVREVAFSSTPDPQEASLSLDGDGLSACCARAVERHLRADVPVGLYLSGGVDSTLSLHYLRAIGITPTCFTIGFAQGDHDETPWAERAAAHYAAPLRVHRVDVPDFDDARAILEYFDEPFYDASAIPTAILNRLAAEEVKVVLGGDGGDELFCGYRRYVHTLGVQALRRRLGRAVGDGLLSLARRIGPRRLRGNKFLENAPFAPVEALFRNSHDLSLLALFRDPELARTTYAEALAAYARAFPAELDPNALFCGDVPNYLSCDILMKADRCSMMHGIEQRAPLLDAELVRLSMRLPAHEKVARGEGKLILKRILADELGRDFAYRRKQGFVFPVRRFLVTNEVAVKDAIASGLAGGLLDPSPVVESDFEACDEGSLARAWKLFVLAGFRLAGSTPTANGRRA